MEYVYWAGPEMTGRQTGGLCLVRDCTTEYTHRGGHEELRRVAYGITQQQRERGGLLASDMLQRCASDFTVYIPSFLVDLFQLAATTLVLPWSHGDTLFPLSSYWSPHKPPFRVPNLLFGFFPLLV